MISAEQWCARLEEQIEALRLAVVELKEDVRELRDEIEKDNA